MVNLGRNWPDIHFPEIPDSVFSDTICSRSALSLRPRCDSILGLPTLERQTLSMPAPHVGQTKASEDLISVIPRLYYGLVWGIGQN